MNRSKTKGTSWERAICAYLRDHGAPAAERRALAGNLDRGDIAGVPKIVIEAKNVTQLTLAGALDEAHLERDNDHADLGVVWAKRRGKGSPGDGYVIMSGEAFVQLLITARYIDP